MANTPVTRSVFVEDLEAIDGRALHQHTVVLHCVTDQGKSFTVPITANRFGRGGDYHRFVLIKKMLASYGIDAEDTIHDMQSWSRLLGKFFRLRLTVGDKQPGKPRPVFIEQFKRCDRFPVRDVNDYDREATAAFAARIFGRSDVL